ncbi:MAG: HAD-IA family hydrolase, partial [Anaeroplasmataceae bacterium]|nr:HAD-IA family hydrolase [Anaeroplasmataceae bacterium]
MEDVTKQCNDIKTLTQEEKEFLADKKNTIYKELLNDLKPRSISISVRTTLETLKQKGLKLAIGSSSKNTMMILEKTDLLKYFDEISDGTKIKNSKPDPEVFLLARDLLGLKTEECLVIEDAKSGIDAASAGGFESCGIGEAKSYSKTTYSISNISDILRIIEPKEHTIKLEHIKKVYPNGLCAVKDFSLEIEPEEFVVFVGPSGCGKSTVLRMIAGLEEITEGKLLIDDEEMNDVEPIRRNISMVFQNYALYPHLTVRQNIVFPLSIQRIPLKYFFNFKYRKERKEEIKRIGEDVASKINLT